MLQYALEFRGIPTDNLCIHEGYKFVNVFLFVYCLKSLCMKAKTSFIFLLLIRFMKCADFFCI